MRARTWCAVLGMGSAFLALRPVGPLDRLVGLVALPTRVLAPTGILSVPFARLGSGAVPEDVRGQEADLSLRLERAVLRSAWPESVEISAGVVPVPGEVDARKGVRRDHITVRVIDAGPIRIDHPVVAGDVYVGRVERIPHRQPTPDRPGFLDRMLRRLGLSRPPASPPKDIIEVALITGADERVGALIPRDQDDRRCRLVVGGLSPRRDRVWLAAHNPESRATVSGNVLVKEPFGRVNGFDSLAEGFALGELKVEPYLPEGDTVTRDVLGVEPPLDFEAGLNQVLVLTDTQDVAAVRARGVLPSDRAGAGALAVPVRQSQRWLPVRLFGVGDTSPWRSSARLDLGRRSGLVRGAAVVDGVRLVGRVARSDAAGSTVAWLDDPGFAVDVMAQALDDPDGEPLVLGRVSMTGRTSDRLEVLWSPANQERYAAWWDAARKGDAELVPVRLWTGSGMVGTPRGLLVGQAALPRLGPTSELAEQRLSVSGFGGRRSELFAWAGKARPGSVGQGGAQ